MRALLLITVGLSLCAGAATPAFGQGNRWVLVADGTASVTGVNNASRSVSGNIRRAWFIRVWDTTQDNGFDYQVMEQEFDCTSRRMRMLNAVGYRLNGSDVSRMSRPSEWQSPIPESVAEAMVLEMCNPTLAASVGVSSIADFVSWTRRYLNLP